MKKRIIMIGMIISIIGICMRSGVFGRIYYSICENKSPILLKLEETYDREDAPFGGLYPVFEVTNTGNKKIIVSSDIGRVADVTTMEKQESVKADFDSLKSVATGHGDSVFWWEYNEEDEYHLYVRTAKYGIVLEQKKVTFTKSDATEYTTQIEDFLCFLDTPFIICIIILAGCLGVLAYPVVFKRKN